jgi:phospholipid transport system substrate-binding protein
MHPRRPLRIFLFFLPVLTLVTSSPLSHAASPFSPLQLVQSGSERGLQLIKHSLFENGPGLSQAKEEILRITDEYFDFSEMAKRALGRPWKEQSAEKQQEFVSLFKQLLFNMYVNRIESTTRPDTLTLYERETIEGDYASVKTRVTNVKGSEFQIDYRLHRDASGWRVYDVLIEGISLVSNYRQQFGSILNTESFESLLSRLKGKVQTQAASS